MTRVEIFYAYAVWRPTTPIRGKQNRVYQVFKQAWSSKENDWSFMGYRGLFCSRAAPKVNP
jgi:hypothetical protein